MAGDIHFIERMDHMTCLDKSTALWESGWWAISSDTASKLVGGRIFFHKAQDKPSFFGGRIIETESNWPGRILFKFIAGQEFRGVRTGRDGWSMVKKIVLAPAL
jgi:hypothetical protein